MLAESKVVSVRPPGLSEAACWQGSKQGHRRRNQGHRTHCRTNEIIRESLDFFYPSSRVHPQIEHQPVSQIDVRFYGLNHAIGGALHKLLEANILSRSALPYVLDQILRCFNIVLNVCSLPVSRDTPYICRRGIGMNRHIAGLFLPGSVPGLPPD